MGASRYQIKYWNRLVNLKFQINYYYQYSRHDSKYDNRIKIFLAISSNSSIAAWVIWDNLQFLWAIIIAISQLVNAIKRYFPFERRKKATEDYCYHLEKLFLEYERDWFYVSNGEWNDEEINKTIINYEIRKEELSRKYLNNIDISSENTKFIEAAEKFTNNYFANNFETGVEDE